MPISFHALSDDDVSAIIAACGDWAELAAHGPLTHRRMSPSGWANEHIITVKWAGDQSGDIGKSTRETMVTWIENGNYAYVQGPQSRSQVGVVDATPKYLRTHANKFWNDNLLSLPTF